VKEKGHECKMRREREGKNSEMINSSALTPVFKAMSWEFLNGLPFESNFRSVSSPPLSVGP
jgi:hypothetical protein